MQVQFHLLRSQPPLGNAEAPVWLYMSKSFGSAWHLRLKNAIIATRQVVSGRVTSVTDVLRKVKGTFHSLQQSKEFLRRRQARAPLLDSVRGSPTDSSSDVATSPAGEPSLRKWVPAQATNKLRAVFFSSSIHHSRDPITGSNSSHYGSSMSGKWNSSLPCHHHQI